jgi:hypothetical protein
MVSRIEPDRYADTGFSVKDTPPEVNDLIFATMMRKTPEQRLLMGFDMMATAREMVWSAIGISGTEQERRRLFFQRFHGEEFPFEL